MYRRISKNKIKRYRKALQAELSKIQKEINRINKELKNNKNSWGFIGKEEIFTDEARIEGEIKACNYILNQCLGK